MRNTATANLWTEDESEWDKMNIVLDERLSLINRCEEINRLAKVEDDNGDETKLMRYMAAVDNAMDTEGVEEDSAGYYSMILGSYEELSHS